MYLHGSSIGKQQREYGYLSYNLSDARGDMPPVERSRNPEGAPMGIRMIVFLVSSRSKLLGFLQFDSSIRPSV